MHDKKNDKNEKSFYETIDTTSFDEMGKELEERRRNLPRETKKSSKGKGLLFMFFAIIFLVGAFFLVRRFLPNYTVEPLEVYYENYNKDIYSLVYNDLWVLDKEPIAYGEAKEIYIPVSFIKEHIDSYIFEDKSVGRVTITTENTVIRMGTEELSYYINDTVMSFNLPVIHVDNELYVALNMIEELYFVRSEIHEDTKIVVLEDRDKEKTMGAVIKSTHLRYDSDNKSPVIEKLSENAALVLFEKKEAYRRVRTTEGVFGYIKEDHINPLEMIPPETQEMVKEHKKPLVQQPIILGFDMLGSVEGNKSKEFETPFINVLSPTWFTFDKQQMNGELIALADKSYVDYAHSKDYQVWGLFSDSFDSEICHTVLTDTHIRETVIRQLLTYAALYELDGINIDLERVTVEDAPFYVQFFRELAPFMKEQGLILSVDMYVPAPYNMHYKRDEVGEIVDYVIVMAYDEHYGGSEVAGPVASLPFVETGIKDTLAEVPKEKVIMGMPYYSRVWREYTDENNNPKVKSPGAYGMNKTYGMFESHGSEFVWDDQIGSYYGEFLVEEASQEFEKGLYRVWLEDEKSIEEKLKIALQYEIAGVAAWYRGLEKDEVWGKIESYQRMAQ